MQLSDAQIAEFEEQGYLFFPGLLDEGEVGILQRTMRKILNRQGTGSGARERGFDCSDAGLRGARVFRTVSGVYRCFRAC